MAAQFTFRKVRWLRADILWINMAATSLPVPLSPRMQNGDVSAGHQDALRLDLAHALAGSDKGCVLVKRDFFDVV